jgi:hypothetical protein
VCVMTHTMHRTEAESLPGGSWRIRRPVLVETFVSG